MSRRGSSSVAKNQMDLAIALSKSLKESEAITLSKLAEELPASAIEGDDVPQNIVQMQKEFLERLQPKQAGPSKKGKQQKRTSTVVPTLLTRSPEDRLRILTEKVALVLLMESPKSTTDDIIDNSIPEDGLWVKSLQLDSSTNSYYLKQILPSLVASSATACDTTQEMYTRLPSGVRIRGPSTRIQNVPSTGDNRRRSLLLSSVGDDSLRQCRPILGLIAGDHSLQQCRPLFGPSAGDHSLQQGQPLFGPSAGDHSMKANEKAMSQTAVVTKNFECKLQADWQYMVNCDAKSDMTITTKEGIKIPAHQIVIFARCKIMLEDMVGNNITWSKATQHDALAFLEFIYCGKSARIRCLTSKEIVIQLAKRYAVKDLLNIEVQPMFDSCHVKIIDNPVPQMSHLSEDKLMSSDSGISQSLASEEVPIVDNRQPHMFGQAEDKLIPSGSGLTRSQTSDNFQVVKDCGPQISFRSKINEGIRDASQFIDLSEESEEESEEEEYESQMSRQNLWEEFKADMSEESQDSGERALLSPDMFADDSFDEKNNQRQGCKNVKILESEEDSADCIITGFFGTSNPTFDTTAFKTAETATILDEVADTVQKDTSVEGVSAICNEKVEQSVDKVSQTLNIQCPDPSVAQSLKVISIPLITIYSDESNDEQPLKKTGSQQILLSGETKNPDGVRKMSGCRKNIFPDNSDVVSLESKEPCSQQLNETGDHSNLSSNTVAAASVVKNMLLEDSFEFNVNDSVLIREAGNAEEHDTVSPCDVELETEKELQGDHVSIITPKDQLATPKQCYTVQEEVTPMPDFKNMHEEELKTQIIDFGLKPGLSRKQNIKLLDHIYKELHPLVEIEIDCKGKKSYAPVEGKDETDTTTTPKKIQLNKIDCEWKTYAPMEEKNNETGGPSAPKKLRSNDYEECAGPSSSNNNGFTVGKETICTDDENAAAAAAPDLKSAIHTFIKDHPTMHDNILRYLPVQLESLQAELKNYLKKSINLGQLKLILDEECITFQTKGRSRTSQRK